MAQEALAAQTEPSKTPRERSPSFPFIPLHTAIARLIALDAKFGRHAAPNDKIGLAWDMKSKSSQALQTTAAVKAFGLVEYSGAGETLQVSISEDGRNYLRAQQESVKAAILKRCALKPKVLARLWSVWGADRPIDEVCLDDLILKQSFTESAARTLLRVYDETVAFSGLARGDKLPPPEGKDGHDEDDDKNDRTDELPKAPKVGDFVRWESEGAIQFDSRRVQGLSPDGAFVFVEGSSTGLPSKEITVVPVPANTTLPPAAPAFVAPPVVGMKQDTFSLDEGTAVLQWPSQLSQSSYDDFKDWIDLQLRKIKRSIQ